MGVAPSIKFLSKSHLIVETSCHWQTPKAGLQINSFRGVPLHGMQLCMQGYPSFTACPLSNLVQDVQVATAESFK